MYELVAIDGFYSIITVLILSSVSSFLLGFIAGRVSVYRAVMVKINKVCNIIDSK